MYKYTNVCIDRCIYANMGGILNNYSVIMYIVYAWYVYNE